jgi:hypothetical protein
MREWLIGLLFVLYVGLLVQQYGIPLQVARAHAQRMRERSACERGTTGYRARRRTNGTH